MRVAVVGAGFVGTTTAVAFAEDGHAVCLVESDAGRRARLEDATLPFHEEGLEEAFQEQVRAGRIQVSGHLVAEAPPDAVYVTVGTPQGQDGSADLVQVQSAAHDIARFLRQIQRYTVVAVKSTVPPGTTERVVRPILQAESDGAPYGLVMCPEFLREGSALEDARHPSRVVIGTHDDRAAEVMRDLHRGSGCPLVQVAPDAAEMIKYVANGFLATKVAFTNEMANVAERLGLDIDEIMTAVGMDPRIAPQFLQAGLGFGGSCFPKDVSALTTVAAAAGAPSTILSAVLAHNEVQPLWAVEAAKKALGTLEGRRIAILGLAFKPGTSDVRETRALPIYHALRQSGCEVVCYDPVAGPAFAELTGEPEAIAPTLDDAVRDADALVLQTAWPEFQRLDPHHLQNLMRHPVILDGRRLLDPSSFRDAGFDHRALGNGTGRYHESRDSSSRPRNEVPARN